MLNARKVIAVSIGLTLLLLLAALMLGPVTWGRTLPAVAVVVSSPTATAPGVTSLPSPLPGTPIPTLSLPEVALPTAPSTQSELPTDRDPVIGAAGDIACDPKDKNFRNGAGSAQSCRERGTSDLLLEMKQRGELTAVLALGDLQYEDGTASAFVESFDKTWGRLKEITYPVAGNHEYHTQDAGPFNEYFGAIMRERVGGYYSFDVGKWHLLAINSNCSNAGGCGVGSAQEAWVRADLAANQGKCTLAYWHHPLFSSGKHGSNSVMRPIWQALYDYGAAIVLNGHDHNYERFAPQDPAGSSDPSRGIRQFVVGTGGKSLRGIGKLQLNSELFSDKSYGILQLTMRPTSYEWRFVSEADRSVTDSGNGVCKPRRP